MYGWETRYEVCMLGAVYCFHGLRYTPVDGQQARIGTETMLNYGCGLLTSNCVSRGQQNGFSK